MFFDFNTGYNLVMTFNTKTKQLFSFDVEADGPCSGLYSMVSFGLVDVFDQSRRFYATLRPISDQYVPEALAVSGFTRAQCMAFDEPEVVMKRLKEFLDPDPRRKMLVSDNPAFDWQFINYYTHRFLGGNPFGHSARRIGDFAAGLDRNFASDSGWKKLRQTKHTHNALDDALGNAQALGYMLTNKTTSRKSKS